MTIAKTTFLTLFVLMFSFSQNISAAQKASIGDIAPDYTLSDQSGDVRTPDALKGENGSVVVFYRSAAWCPYCQKQLIDLSEYHDKFAEQGYELVGISYDNQEVLQKFYQKHDISFPLLSDEGSKVINAFGILNEDLVVGSKAYGVPYPAVYVINAEGEITHVFAEEGYKDRPTPEKILQTLKEAAEE